MRLGLGVPSLLIRRVPEWIAFAGGSPGPPTCLFVKIVNSAVSGLLVSIQVSCKIDELNRVFQRMVGPSNGLETVPGR